MASAYPSAYLSDAELTAKLTKLIEMMKEHGFIQKNVSTDQILEHLKSSLEQAKDNGLELTPDLFSKDNLKLMMTLIMSSTLELQFKDQLELVEGVPTTAELATFLLSPARTAQEKLDAKFALAAAIDLHRKSPVPETMIDQSIDNTATPAEPRPAVNEEQKQSDDQFEQFYGQDRFGNIMPRQSLITDGAAIVKNNPDLGPGKGGLLEEIEHLAENAHELTSSAPRNVPEGH